MELLQLIPILVEGYNPITGSLSIDIVGVGSKPSEWLEIFRTIVAVIIAILAVLGLETLIRIFKGKK